ncbi:TPA: DUF401 family protein [bacterium]|nr:DUF401 family protein [bacterium]
MFDILKLVLVLLLMIVIVARKLDLIYAIFAGAVATGLLFNHELGILIDLYKTIKDWQTINILLMFFFVFLLSNILTDSGILSNMLVSLERLIRDIRFVIISLPFIIGLVPAPSGAMLSAPFVQELGTKMGMSPERKLIINYWFRHITEYLNPVYPGPILVVAILGITFKELVILNLPIMIFVFILGFVMYVTRLKHENADLEKPTKKDVLVIMNGILPIIIAVILPIFFKVNLALSVMLSVVLIMIINKLNIRILKSVAKKSVKVNLLILIFSVMFFKMVLNNSRAIELVSKAMVEYGFHPIALVTIVPLIAGFVTGITIGYVGLTFPLLLPFLKSNHNLIMLAYVSGYIGILVSPAHLCFSVTQKYFHADYKKVYKQLIPSIIMVLGFALLLTLFGWFRNR